jgi:hypothetical protein
VQFVSEHPALFSMRLDLKALDVITRSSGAHGCSCRYYTAVAAYGLNNVCSCGTLAA